MSRAESQYLEAPRSTRQVFQGQGKEMDDSHLPSRDRPPQRRAFHRPENEVWKAEPELEREASETILAPISINPPKSLQT